MRKIIFIIAGIIVAVTVIALVIFLFKPSIDANEMRSKINVEKRDTSLSDNIHFLNTDSSDCILLESDGHYALIDAGEDSDNPRGFEWLEYKGYEQEILEYLKNNIADENGKVHLDFVLGTHSHSDHIGGFDTIISDDAVEIDRAYLKKYNEAQINDHEVSQWDNKEVYEQMVDALNKKQIPIISKMNDEPFMLGNFKLTLFNTDDNNKGKVGENDNSLGVLVEKCGARIFLAGDIDNKSRDEERLAPLIGKVNALKVGHHSYSGSTTLKWLRTLKPEVCVVTNSYKKVDNRTLKRIYLISKSPVLITGKENGVIIHIDDNGELTYYNNIY